MWLLPRGGTVAHVLLWYREVVQKLVELGRARSEFEEYSLLFLLTYAFLLRLPSEALPLTAMKGDFHLEWEGYMGLASMLCHVWHGAWCR